MLMLMMAVLGVIQIIRAFLMLAASGSSSEQVNTMIIGLLCLAVAELARRQNAAMPDDEEKQVVPNRPHPLARPQRARPSVPALPSDK